MLGKMAGVPAVLSAVLLTSVVAGSEPSVQAANRDAVSTKTPEGTVPRSPSQRNVDFTRQANFERFSKAYALIQDGRYEEALGLLERNIAETPNAGNIDYSYGWACVCAAHLGDMGRTLKYYAVLRTRFYGWLRFGAGGANREWDSQLAMVRRAVASSEHPDKEAVLQKMADMDDEAHRRALGDLDRLVRRAVRGDQIAIEQLRQAPYGLVDLIIEGRLLPAPASPSTPEAVSE